MRIHIKESVLIISQVLLLAYLFWQIGTMTSTANTALATALFLLVVALGTLRTAIRRTQQKSYLAAMKQIQDSELSAHIHLANVDAMTRREIAAWIHGDLQSSLIKVGQSLRKNGHFEASDELERINNGIVRRLAHQLFPPQLEVSLHLALTDLCHERAKLTMSDNLNLALFKNFKSRIVPFQLRLAAYRIVEEAINNAEKKPSTTTISVSVEACDDLLQISVLDNGMPLIDEPKHSLGFALINTYVRQFQGDWKIQNTQLGVHLTASLSFAYSDLVEKMVPEPILRMKKGQTSDS